MKELKKRLMLTLEKAVHNHKKMWMQLAEHPEWNKLDLPEWKCNGGDIPMPKSYCWACEFAQQQRKRYESKGHYCNWCIFDWGHREECKEDSCCSSYSPYVYWTRSKHILNMLEKTSLSSEHTIHNIKKQISHAAITIMNLPLNIQYFSNNTLVTKIKKDTIS